MNYISRTTNKKTKLGGNSSKPFEKASSFGVRHGYTIVTIHFNYLTKPNINNSKGKYHNENRAWNFSSTIYSTYETIFVMTNCNKDLTFEKLFDLLSLIEECETLRETELPRLWLCFRGLKIWICIACSLFFFYIETCAVSIKSSVTYVGVEPRHTMISRDAIQLTATCRYTVLQFV